MERGRRNGYDRVARLYACDDKSAHRPSPSDRRFGLPSTGAGFQPLKPGFAERHRLPKYFSAEALSKPVAITLFQPSSLVQILRRLERDSGVRFLINWEALSHVRWGMETENQLHFPRTAARRVAKPVSRPARLKLSSNRPGHHRNLHACQVTARM